MGVGENCEKMAYKATIKKQRRGEPKMSKRYVGHIPGFLECWLLYAYKNVYILPVAKRNELIQTVEGDFFFADFVEIGQNI